MGARTRLAAAVAVAASAVVSGASGADGVAHVFLHVTTPTVCSPPATQLRPLSAAVPMMTPVGGSPFGIVSTADGRWSFVSLTAGRVVVIDQRGARPSVAHELGLQGGDPAGEALTRNGRYLLIARGAGAAVLDVGRAERGSPKALLGDVDVSASSGADVESAIEVAVAPDDRYAFVSLEYADEVAVFDLRRRSNLAFGSTASLGRFRSGWASWGWRSRPTAAGSTPRAKFGIPPRDVVEPSA